MSKYPDLRHASRAPGISYALAYTRLEMGWDLARAVNTPRGKVGRGKGPRKPYRLRTKAQVEDTSPDHIRKIRVAFCEEFARTGVINTELQSQLKAYADECRTTQKHPTGISDEPAGRGRGQPGPATGDDRDGDGVQVDAGTAERIADFLRAA